MQNQKARQLFWLSRLPEGYGQIAALNRSDPVWLKCFRGVADAPQIFALD
jgi:hypothetical protein